jgi:glyoxylase-like metal-dependent hydrolase (beta-lactamase superfamily II)
MTEVKVLIEGYAREIDNGWIASSTATLIKDSNKNVLIDPGCNREKLLAALKKEGLETKDMHYVVLTHSHADHALLAGIFESAKILTPTEIYENDKQVAYGDSVPETSIKVIKTPGHCAEHISLVVATVDGIYAVAGDVFWWKDDETQKPDIKKEDNAHAEGMDMKKLTDSRQKLLEIAKWVIPGHGKTFEVKK